MSRGDLLKILALLAGAFTSGVLSALAATPKPRPESTACVERLEACEAISELRRNMIDFEIEQLTRGAIECQRRCWRRH